MTNAWKFNHSESFKLGEICEEDEEFWLMAPRCAFVLL